MGVLKTVVPQRLQKLFATTHVLKVILLRCHNVFEGTSFFCALSNYS